MILIRVDREFGWVRVRISQTHSKCVLPTPGCEGYDTASCGGLNMDIFWSIFFWLVPIWVFVLIPFSTFYYEADDLGPPPTLTGETPAAAPKQRSRLSQALCNLTVLLVFVIIFFFVAYWFLAYSYVPVQPYTGPTLLDGARPAGVIFETQPNIDSNGVVQNFVPSELADMQPNDALLLESVEMADSVLYLVYRVDVATFCGGLMTFLGWFLFAIFGGIGIAALPLHNILTFTRRPKMLTPEEMEDAKTSLQDRVNEMVEIGEQLKREREEKSKTSAKRGLLASFFPTFFHQRSSTLREFKAAVFLLEEDVRDFTAYRTTSEKYNPLYPYLALLMGFVSAVFSISWILQTLLYTLPNPYVSLLLNGVFEWFDSWFPLFGTLGVAFCTVYLLFCAIQGCFVFGLRFLCLSFYPMKTGGTYMSSFLFNTGLVLLSSLPVLQFAVISFDDYAKYATIRQIYVEQIGNLDFFKYFFDSNVFLYVLLITSFLTGIYMMYKRQGVEGAELRDRLKSRARGATSPGPVQTGNAANSSMGETGEETFEDEHYDDGSYSDG